MARMIPASGSGAVVREDSQTEPENETTPPEQRKPEGAPIGDGPKMGKNNEYQPASYVNARGNIRTDR